MLFRLLFCCLLLTCTASLRAQTFQGSLLAGGIFSQIDSDDLIGFNQFGFTGGARVVAVLSDKWRVGPEITFSQQGSRRAPREPSNFGYENIRLNFVEVPLMVYYKDWRITAEAGATYGRLIDFTVEDVLGEDLTEDFFFNENIFGLQVGATFYFTPRVGLNFRWSRQFSALGESPDGKRLRGRNISFRMVYTFGAGETQPEKPEEERRFEKR